MGWSIDLAREDIDNLFTNMGVQYRLTHVGAETPSTAKAAISHVSGVAV